MSSGINLKKSSALLALRSYTLSNSDPSINDYKFCIKDFKTKTECQFNIQSLIFTTTHSEFINRKSDRFQNRMAALPIQDNQSSIQETKAKN